MFYWNAKHLPASYKQLNLQDPLRAAFITNPRNFTYRIYYNQASSSNDGTMKLVNWFDGNNLGLNSEPLLPDIKQVYKSFNQRHFVVPITHVSISLFNAASNCFYIHTRDSNVSHIMQKNFQSPPWIFINYIEKQEKAGQDHPSTSSATKTGDQKNKAITNDDDDEMTMAEENSLNATKTDIKFNVNKLNRKELVVSGRDDVLLNLLATKMNFKFEYVDVKMMKTNVTMSGTLGLQKLQRRVCSLKLLIP